MDATEALAELAELSSQVEFAVAIAEDGKIEGWTREDAVAIESLAQRAQELLEAASTMGSTSTEATRAEVELAEGALFVLRERGHTIAATTGPDPTPGLVVYDLRTCLERIAEDDAPKRRRRARRGEDEA